MTEKIKVIYFENLKRKMAPRKKLAEVDENSTPSRLRKTKGGCTNIENRDKTTMNNTTEKPCGAGEAFEMPVVTKIQIKTIKSKAVVCYGFDDQLKHKVRSGYSEPFMEVNGISCFWLMTITVQCASVSARLTPITTGLLF